MNKFPIAAAIVVLFAAPGIATGQESQSTTSPETLTREQIRADGAESIRHGILSSGELSFWQPTASTNDRARIAAEGQEAMRLGLFDDGEVTRAPTDEERNRVEMAGALASSRDAEGSGR